MGAKEPPRLEGFTQRGEETTPDVFEVSGSVKWFDPSKGYGFIVPDEDLPEILVHVTCLRAASLTSTPKISSSRLKERPAIGCDDIGLQWAEQLPPDLTDRSPHAGQRDRRQSGELVASMHQDIAARCNRSSAASNPSLSRNGVSLDQLAQLEEEISRVRRH